MTEGNKEIAVVYKSKYGSTKQYGKWIAEEVNADLFARSDMKIEDLLKYETIVVGGALYAVGITGIDLIKDNFEELKDKKLIVFAVGASPARKEVVEDVLNSNFSEEIKEKINFFMLRGAFDYSKLNFLDKIKMWFLELKLNTKKEEELTADEKGMLASYDQPVDWTNKEAITPIINCITGGSKK